MFDEHQARMCLDRAVAVAGAWVTDTFEKPLISALWQRRTW